MDSRSVESGWTRLEARTTTFGFVLVGFAIAVTATSYLLHMQFTPQWLVWAIGAAFVVVALLAIVWPFAFHRGTEAPGGKYRRLLLLSMPLAFVVSSQVCGLGARACNVTCHVTNLALIALTVVVAFRLEQRRSVGALMIPMVLLSLVPHCVCHAPINTVWHNFLGGVAPTCEMVPMAAVLFSVSAIRGAQPRGSTGLVAAMFAVMIFIIVGGLLFGFPWQGCVDHPPTA